MRARGNGALRFATPDAGAATARLPRRDEAADARALELLERAGTKRSVLLKGGTIVTMDPVLGNLVGDVLAQGIKIAEVSPDVSAATTTDVIVVDAADMIITPGFVVPPTRLGGPAARLGAGSRP